MKITKQRYSSLCLCRHGHVLFEKVNLRMDVRHWITPASIEVNPSQWRSRIANNHSIRIDHWNQFDYVIIQYRIILLIIQAEFANNMTHYKAAMRLRCMKPCLNVNTLPFPLSQSTILRWFLCKGKLIHIQTSNTLGNHFLSIDQIIIYNLKVFPVFLVVLHR